MFLYNLTIHVLRFWVWIVARFHPKVHLFVEGRRGTFDRIRSSLAGNTSPLIWVHCASLGEFEQGRPIIETFRKEYPAHKILLTFFSPSGYEVRKNYQGADYVEYLPVDTISNARKWIQVTKPKLAVFIKYEFWLNYASQLRHAGVPMISVSSIFRPDQIFFRSYGQLFRKTLRMFDHFFVQDSESAKLLSSINITAVTIAGDTRFDRVNTLIKSAERVAIAEAFKGTDRVLVAGSTWEEDLEVLVPFINESTEKVILAPHEIEEDTLQKIEEAIEGRVVRFSKAGDAKDLETARVLLVDNIGMLSRLYRYGESAYVGGGFGKGLHNILEAACYGVPIFFGDKNYTKFREARELIMRGGAFEVSDFSDFREKYASVSLPENFLLACEVTRSYVQENLGATDKVLHYCRPILRS